MDIILSWSILFFGVLPGVQEQERQAVEDWCHPLPKVQDEGSLTS